VLILPRLATKCQNVASRAHSILHHGETLIGYTFEVQSKHARFREIAPHSLYLQEVTVSHSERTLINIVQVARAKLVFRLVESSEVK
jgi:hypothetical protein